MLGRGGGDKGGAGGRVGIRLDGGGIKGGMIGGASDDFGFKAFEGPAHIHDLHATILFLMGIDHEKALQPGDDEEPRRSRRRQRG